MLSELIKRYTQIAAFSFGLFIMHAHGAEIKCDESMTISLKDKKYKICFSESENAWLDESCFKNKGCEARKFLAPIPDDQLIKDKPTTKNPCTDHCIMRGGKIEFGENERGSTTSFCVAKDESMVDCAHLVK